MIPEEDSPRVISNLTRNTLALIMAGGRGSRLKDLAAGRAKPAEQTTRRGPPVDAGRGDQPPPVFKSLRIHNTYLLMQFDVFLAGELRCVQAPFTG